MTAYLQSVTASSTRCGACAQLFRTGVLLQLLRFACPLLLAAMGVSEESQNKPCSDCIHIDFGIHSEQAPLPRLFHNESLHNGRLFAHGHQCPATNLSRAEELSKQEFAMRYTPNRRSQSESVDAMDTRPPQAVLVLTVGGHSEGNYNYGPMGSVNGLLSVWDSWLENFLSYNSNSTSLLLLFDERDFSRQRMFTTRQAYLNNILIENIGATAVKQVQFSGLPSEQHFSPLFSERNSPVDSSTGKSPADEAVQSGNKRQPHLPTHTVHENLRHNQVHHPVRPVHGAIRPAQHPVANSGLTTGTHRYLQSDNSDANNSEHVFDDKLQQSTFADREVNGPTVESTGSNYLSLDDGYYIYYVDVARYRHSKCGPYQQPLVVFASVYRYPPPNWASNSREEDLFKSRQPSGVPRGSTNYAYVKMTNWYSYHMLNLALLDYFEYAAKIDSDLSFTTPFFERNIPMRMAKNNFKLLVPNKNWSRDTLPSRGVAECINNYIQAENKRCVMLQGIPQQARLIPGGKNVTALWKTAMDATVSGYFIFVWLGLFTAVETVNLAKHWNDWHPRGMWEFRWGDQQFWPRPLALFGTSGLEKEVEFVNPLAEANPYIIHKLERSERVRLAMYYNPLSSTKEYRRQWYDALSRQDNKLIQQLKSLTREEILQIK